MLGLFGDSVIGTDHFTGPTSDTEEVSARLVRHDRVRGKPVLQDLGNDASTKQLRFFFDETFCDPELELRKINAAFKTRTPMRLYFDFVGFELGAFIIERLTIERKKTSSRGKLVRVEIDVDLVESVGVSFGLLGAAASLARAILNPTLRK